MGDHPLESCFGNLTCVLNPRQEYMQNGCALVLDYGLRWLLSKILILLSTYYVVNEYKFPSIALNDFPSMGNLIKTWFVCINSFQSVTNCFTVENKMRVKMMHGANGLLHTCQYLCNSRIFYSSNINVNNKHLSRPEHVQQFIIICSR